MKLNPALAILFSFLASTLAAQARLEKFSEAREILQSDTLVRADGTMEVVQISKTSLRFKVTPDTGFFYAVAPSASVVQSAFVNWVEGGTNALAWSIGLEIATRYQTRKIIWRNDFTGRFGQTKNEGQEFRKTVDNFEIISQLRYNLVRSDVFYPQFSFTLRSQFAPGFDYSKPNAPQISAFFDPAYAVQSFGLFYEEPSRAFNASMGFAFREIIARRFTSFSDRPETPRIERVNFTTGIEIKSSWTLDLTERTRYQGRVQLFSSFENLRVWDVNFRNALTTRLFESLQVQFLFALVYQDRLSKRVQLSQTLELAFRYRFANH
ncbi:MAG: DUF3078 domain-containing protein [Chloroherpetonaceae bacterium]|nr:DUF3078 domain-containing protein [Chloroherpetonaceae bacterium]MDW8438638.1 DUF3078 domain-containing protein [Chloroherpetonaceae bacterium]